jgi:hypothetical protein
VQTLPERLQPLLGEWEVKAALPGAEDLTGRMAIEPMLGGAFLAQRSQAPDPIPDSFCVISAAAEGDGFTQHYFDTRGVIRVYAMTFEDGIWTLSRERPDFTPLSFSQKFSGKLSADRRVIRGLFERTDEAGAWTDDFEVTYTRVG